MIDASSRSARALATTAVFGVAIVHSAMNASFGWSMGSTDHERYLFAGFGVCLDIAKVFALAFAAYSWDRGRRIKAACCILVWATTVFYSGAAALGFAALARDTVVASRSADVDDYKENAAEKRRHLADMEAARTNPLFTETFGCTQDLAAKDVGKDKATKAKQFCHMYWRASAKYDAIKPIVRNSTVTQADPQTALVASIFSASREQAAMGLAIFLAVVAEIVSALGTFVFSKSIRKPDRAEMAERREARKSRRSAPYLAVSN